uniref:Uncharacterized protein n=1 Tax=Arundo donax TaxID=35708 RepID=A0A0A9GFV7_ARUDO
MAAWPLPVPTSPARRWCTVSAASLENRSLGYTGRAAAYTAACLVNSPAIGVGP